MTLVAKTVFEKIRNHHPELLLHVSGPLDVQFENVLPPALANGKSLCFCSDAGHYNDALKSSPAVLIVLQKTWPSFEAEFKKNNPNLLIFKTQNLSMAMAQVLSFLDQKSLRFHKGHHPTAVISPTATVAPTANIGAYAVIGDNCKIGDAAFIGPHCIVESHSTIGDRSLLHGHVFIGANTQIGSGCEIHAHTTLGSDGFGYSSDQNFKHSKIPQLGRVVIENNVEIGANCAIDRATLTETRIKAGTKIDNLCHIAHNCEIGSDSLVAAGFMTAGSSKIGARFVTGGNSVVSSHLEITDGVMLAGRSTVTNDITESGSYGGYPLQPLKEALKTISSLTHLTKLRKQMSMVIKHLGLEDKINESKKD